MQDKIPRMRNCLPEGIGAAARMPLNDFRLTAVDRTQKGMRVVSFFGIPGEAGETILIMVLAYDREGYMEAISASVAGSYPALTPQIPQVHLFEREIYEQYGVRPLGHPWLKPVRVHHPCPSCTDDTDRTNIPAHLKVSGAEVHEVAVGPVHAGVIEPGHFRFQCHGENVLHLEIFLGYQHRGIEKALTAAPDKRVIHYMETLAGDTSIGHTLAYCQAVEGLSGCVVPLRAAVIRAIMLELERLANHTGDLGALAGDVGYLPTSSYCGRLRGDFLNMTALVCGNRFGRNMVRPGGVLFDIDDSIAGTLKERLTKVFADVKSAVSLMLDSAMVVDRFDETGIVTEKAALELGMVGVAARACGIERDARFDFPSGAFKFFQIPMSTHSSGDVFSRAFVRWLELQRSVEFILEHLNSLPDGDIKADVPANKPEKIIISLVEGWRGEICHTAITDRNGNIAHYKVIDPSFHNWMGLAMALRGGEISDFPLCNKSFNLSYCGHDL